MGLFHDNRICKRCGGAMEVHVDYHCSVCGWNPTMSEDEEFKPTFAKAGALRRKSAEEMLREMMDPGKKCKVCKTAEISQGDSIVSRYARENDMCRRCYVSGARKKR